MATQKKKTILAELKEKFQNAQGVFFTDYQGLDVNSMADLRAQLKETDADFTIAKNTLLEIAQDEVELEGPTATLFTYGDPIPALKVLTEFKKKFEKPAFKSGLFEGSTLSKEQIEELSALPGREVLLGKLVGLLNAPVTNFAGILKANQRNFVYALKEIAEKK